MIATTATTEHVRFQSARRINQSLTAAAEKRALVWMAERAPSWLSPDHLTVLGLGAQIAAGACYALARFDRRVLIAGILFLALNWLGDSLDGTLARVRRQERPRYGFYVDHVVDVFGASALLWGLGCSGYLHWQTAGLLLIAFLLLACESYLATYTLQCFQLSQGIFGPTELRLLLVAGNLELLRSPYATLFGHRLLLFDVGGIIAAGAMFALAVVVTARHIAQLYRLEPTR